MHQTLTPPALFYVLAAVGTILILISIVAAIVLAPESNPTFHFDELGLVTAISAVSLAFASAFSFVVFYLRSKDLDIGSLFWLVLALGCCFLSLDEQLMFHERGGRLVEAAGAGPAEFFRNWNDLIVILYGVAALAAAVVFRREILKCKAFAALFAIGFGFYVLHTGIDSILPKSVTWKDFPEESSKLLSVFTLMLATCAQLMAMIDAMFHQQAQPIDGQ